MTEREATLLEMFRILDRCEQNIILGKMSELILNKKNQKINFFEDVKIKYYPIVFIYIF